MGVLAEEVLALNREWALGKLGVRRHDGATVSEVDEQFVAAKGKTQRVGGVVDGGSYFGYKFFIHRVRYVLRVKGRYMLRWFSAQPCNFFHLAFMRFISALTLTFCVVVWLFASYNQFPWLSRRIGRRLETAGGLATRRGLSAYQ